MQAHQWEEVPVNTLGGESLECMHTLKLVLRKQIKERKLYSCGAGPHIEPE